MSYEDFACTCPACSTFESHQAEIKRLKHLIGHCDQCGKCYADRACGPTHAVRNLMMQEPKSYMDRARREGQEDERKAWHNRLGRMLEINPWE